MLAQIRKSRKLSQGQLSKLSNVPVRMIQQWEQGQKNIDRTNINYLTSLAIVLGCRIEDIIENRNVQEKLRNIYGKDR